jgi:hypothetical protein
MRASGQCGIRHALAAAMPLALLVACGKSGGGAAVPQGAESIQQLGVETALLAVGTKPPTEMPALNAQGLAELAADTPELKAQLPALEAGERAAIRHVMDEALAKLAPAAQPATPATAARVIRGATRNGSIPVLDWFISPAGAAEGGLDWGSLQGVVVGYLTTSFMGSAADQGHGEPGSEQMRSEYTDKSGEKASMVVKTEKDGQVTTELDSGIDIPLFLMEANTKVSITTRGLCPDAAGKVEFTLRSSSGGSRGRGKNMAYDHTREVHVTATVNDDAEIADADIDTQYGDRSTAGGRQSYAGASTSWTVPGGDVGKMRVISHGNVRLSQDAGAAEAQRLTQAATNAVVLGVAALEGAKGRWQGGACIRLKATSPGRVKRKAVTSIPVAVIHKLDGSEVAARVKVELTGGESVTPALIPRAPGTLTHTAPDAKVALMSIKLTARSRRGMAVETLKLSVSEGAFNADGGAGEFHGTGLICSLSAPFEISGSGVTVKFTPTSELGGTYTYDGGMGGFHLYGQGTFRVISKEGVPVEIFGTGPGNVDNASGGGDEHYKLTPAQDYHCDDKLLN